MSGPLIVIAIGKANLKRWGMFSLYLFCAGDNQNLRLAFTFLWIFKLTCFCWNMKKKNHAWAIHIGVFFMLLNTFGIMFVLLKCSKWFPQLVCSKMLLPIEMIVTPFYEMLTTAVKCLQYFLGGKYGECNYFHHLDPHIR